MYYNTVYCVCMLFLKYLTKGLIYFLYEGGYQDVSDDETE